MIFFVLKFEEKKRQRENFPLPLETRLVHLTENTVCIFPGYVNSHIIKNNVFRTLNQW